MSQQDSSKRRPSAGVSDIAVIAEVIATLAVALWLGGMLALGAFAAPEVFGQLPRETAGSVMGAIFGKFDSLVLVVAGLLLVAEAVRLVLEGTRGKLGLARLAVAGALVVLALLSALWLGPAINDLFEAGVRRGVGDDGADMDRLHHLAELLGKVAFFLAAVWITLGILLHRRAVAGGVSGDVA